MTCCHTPKVLIEGLIVIKEKRRATFRSSPAFLEKGIAMV
jgi:hypothetical protein